MRPAAAAMSCTAPITARSDLLEENRGAARPFLSGQFAQGTRPKDATARLTWRSGLGHVEAQILQRPRPPRLRRTPEATAEEVQIVAAQHEETLRADFEEMRAEVLHMDQRMLLRIHRVGLAGPTNHLAGSRIEDGHQSSDDAYQGLPFCAAVCTWGGRTVSIGPADWLVSSTDEARARAQGRPVAPRQRCHSGPWPGIATAWGHPGDG